MSRFNLLDEPWIPVLPMGGEKQKEVSLIELFKNAQDYQCLAGEMETQNFAMLRLLLAIVETVFSRFDADGNSYPYITLDDRMVPTEPVDEDDFDDYTIDLDRTWDNIREQGRFPEIVCIYLEKWKDHFYLLDEKFPFYQVTKEEMMEFVPSGKKPTTKTGKTVNLLISESENKIALFSPIAKGTAENKTDGWKSELTEAQLMRWLLTLQGYAGTADKTSLLAKGQQASKGWLFDIGGIYIKGDNLFETLLLNDIPYPPNAQNHIDIQNPCWEHSGEDNVKSLLRERRISNYAELYTNWSRAAFIDPSWTPDQPAAIQIAKVASIAHMDHFIEPMTMWRLNKDGSDKGHQTPRKHRPEQAMWRSFGTIMLKANGNGSDGVRRPEILNQLNRIRENRRISICAISMQDDGNATSWLPIDEITDMLSMNELIAIDDTDNGWLVRINDIIENVTKPAVEIYRYFLQDIADIRAMDSKKKTVFVSVETEKFYQKLNDPFNNWLASIQPGDEKAIKEEEWHDTLKRLLLAQGEKVMHTASIRDYRGIQKNDRQFNIFNAYAEFKNAVWKKLG